MDLGTGSIHTQTTSYDLATRRSFGNTYTEAPLAACIGVTMDIAHLQSIPHTFNDEYRVMQCVVLVVQRMSVMDASLLCITWPV